MGWLGLDDTDTVDEGCTTFSLHALIEALPDDVKVGRLRLVPFEAMSHSMPSLRQPKVGAVWDESERPQQRYGRRIT